MVDHINLVKLCVGAKSVEDLVAWQKTKRSRNADGLPCHVTRMWPKREAELLAGGSIFWVMKGLIQARQRISSLEERVGADGIRRCAIVLDPRIIRTEAAPRRAFQGWRYLPVDQAPRDLPEGRASEASLPPALLAALAEIGVR
ncbi:lysophospholipase [Brevirhabdus pacifica]|uniref:Lysophospholipase n=1 Tax=Brevirhabdus pacifica TaxID=1267768 RepID=A0A1U7DK55_9RHOB|nr:DUF1489 domain-containing protein [Brevirhabdus pacifica]APX90366.1 lysophospholipase [Brevirhabdus pacifica]OWU78603.1 lysophospholipase [Loktanella sp. 22II-4b]PJJ80823.1 hypothetical protein CLV77_3095 [Brevirhabdus pacifica]